MGTVKGFTLIEILVVLVIIGITLALASVNFSYDDRQVLRSEGERLAVLLQQAQDEAMLTGKTLAWSRTASGYQFQVLDRDDNWLPLQNDTEFRERAWAPSIVLLEVAVDRALLNTDERIVFGPGGINPPFTALLGLGKQRILITGDAMGKVSIGNETTLAEGQG